MFVYMLSMALSWWAELRSRDRDCMACWHGLNSPTEVPQDRGFPEAVSALLAYPCVLQKWMHFNVHSLILHVNSIHPRLVICQPRITAQSGPGTRLLPTGNKQNHCAASVLPLKEQDMCPLAFLLVLGLIVAMWLSAKDRGSCMQSTLAQGARWLNDRLNYLIPLILVFVLCQWW